MTTMNLLTVRQVAQNASESITTGDSVLDNILGGGIRPGVITELVGESASGKTQLALQLSLCVQLPIESRGLAGSACYLTTKGALQTSRLVEIAQSNPAVFVSSCNLDNIHTRPSSSVPELKHTLSHGVPSLIQSLSKNSAAKPLKLLILDSIGAIFRSDTKTSTKTLADRSREIVETASMLHHLASSFHLAILIINEVNATFLPDVTHESNPDQLLYSEQARWFSRGDSVSGEALREAGLGLAWANQVGIRIMLTRTGRRRYIEPAASSRTKRRQLDVGDESSEPDRKQPEAEATLIRRLSVIFSSFSSPGSVDFIITQSGVICPEEI